MPVTDALQHRVIAQFHRPHGALGRVAGWIMGTRRSNVERNRWTVDVLAPAPDARVLEVGFGPGVAIEALAARLTEGVVHGIDHSALMVAKASERNAAAIAQGRVVLAHGTVDALDDTLAPLDLVFAVNNAFMWPDPPAQVARLAALLGPGGRLAIVTQPRGPGSDPARSREVAAENEKLLAGAGLAAVETHWLELSPPVSLVVGRLAPVPARSGGANPRPRA